jgi:hypothetical protein
VSTMIGMATIGDTMEHSLVGGGTERTNPCDGVQNGVGRPGSVPARLRAWRCGSDGRIMDKADGLTSLSSPTGCDSMPLVRP